MGAILSFVPRPSAARNQRPLDAGAAAVIIFPGVRYERPEGAQADHVYRGGALDDKASGPAKH